jgi:cytochrome c oxidase assembly factor CtaG
MSATLQAILGSWPFDAWLVATLAIAAGVYLRGWLVLRRRGAGRWSAGRLVAFQAGLAALFLALGSPVEPLAAWLLQVHVTQHLLLMMVAPPLVWLGAPLLPFVRGLPRTLRSDWVVEPVQQRRALPAPILVITA